MIIMFDDVTLSLIPANAQAVGAYVNGKFANIDEARRLFPHAHILPIAVSSGQAARCLDVEPGDATNAGAVTWYHAQKKVPGEKLVLYTSASNVTALVVALFQAGIRRDEYLVWSAHFTGVAHVCGPHTCGFPQADGTQWTDRALGKSLDESLLSDEFFPVAKPPAPKPDTGAATATVKCFLRRKDNIWEVHGTAGHAHFGGPDRFEEAVIGVNLQTGHWRIKRK